MCLAVLVEWNEVLRVVHPVHVDQVRVKGAAGHGVQRLGVLAGLHADELQHAQVQVRFAHEVERVNGDLAGGWDDLVIDGVEVGAQLLQEVHRAPVRAPVFPAGEVDIAVPGAHAVALVFGRPHFLVRETTGIYCRPAQEQRAGPRRGLLPEGFRLQLDAAHLFQVCRQLLCGRLLAFQWLGRKDDAVDSLPADEEAGPGGTFDLLVGPAALCSVTGLAALPQRNP